jgi:hypothetical protein
VGDADASTDYEFGTCAASDMVADSVWAKLTSLVEGVRLATGWLWGESGRSDGSSPNVC